MFKSGEQVYQQNSISNSAYYVRQGYLKIYRIGAKGQQQIIRLAKQGDIVGYHSLLTNEPEATSCECLVNSVLCEISNVSLEDYLLKNKQLSSALLKLSCEEIKLTCDSILLMTQSSVIARMANLLIRLFELFELKAGEDFPFQISRDDLANWVGTSKESISRSLNMFHKEGLINLQKRKFQLKDIEGLKKVVLIS